MQRLVLLGAVAMTAFGCNGGNAAYSPPPDSANSAKDPTATRSAEPEREFTPPKPAITFRPETFKIEPKGTKGWRQDSAELSDLGRKVDEAILNVKEALVAVDTNYNVAGNELTGRGMVKIRDNKTFNIEFITPQTEAKINRAYGLKGERKILYNEKWQKLTAAGGPVTSKTMDETEVREFAGSFSAHIFDPFLRDRYTFGPLLAALDSGSNGFKATVESKKDTVQGKERSYYRVVAEATKGDLQMEILIDANRLLPLTIRSVKKTDKGEDVYMWSGSWAFGGNHSDSDFAIPAEK